MTNKEFNLHLHIIPNLVSRAMYLLEQDGYDLTEIDLDALNMEDGYWCVCGQLEGSYETFFTKFCNMFGDSDFAEKYIDGMFETPDDLDTVQESVYYDHLTAEWRKQLGKYQKARKSRSRIKPVETKTPVDT